MKTPARLFSALSIILLFFLTSCASTKVTSEWKDPNFFVPEIQEDHGTRRCQATAQSQII